ncbi:MAG: hypothetical protein JNM94_06115 [Phycisphaerae bacterium]|nr:hypothetical protein [Phycisphaerae bacterium]
MRRPVASGLASAFATGLALLVSPASLGQADATTPPPVPARNETAPPTAPDAPAARTAVTGIPAAIPNTGAVPPAVRSDPKYRGDLILSATPDDRDVIEAIRKQYFTKQGSSEAQRARRAEGIAKLKTITNPSAMVPMYEMLRTQSDDIVLGVLDHFSSLGEGGQAALAWIAINDEDERIRHEATRRITKPATPAVLGVLDNALRSNTHMVVNRAGALAGTLNAIETLPLLIFAQATRDRIERKGDLAWIAIGTQMSYVSNVVPVLGDNSGAFQPIIGVINEGVLLRVTDAVVITYRTEVHTALVNMTSADWGQSTEYLGFDPARWYAWFNDEYIPFKKGQADELARREKAKALEREAIDEDV